MKAFYQTLLPVTVGLVLISGCAPARLSVHVDLYRFTESNKESLNHFAHVRAVQIEVGKLQQDIASLFANYRLAETNLLKARIANARRLPDKKEQASAVEAQEDVFAQLMKNARAFESQFQLRFKALNRKVSQWAGLAQQLQADNSGQLAEAERQRQDVVAAIEGIYEQVSQELAPQKTGDSTPRVFSFAGIRQEMETLKRNFDRTSPKDSADETLLTSARQNLVATEKAASAAEAGEIKVVAQAEKAVQKAQGEAEYTNPDALADDSDPFYQVLANPNFRPGWSTNFFMHEASADGKVSFLIVRESPVRFSVNEAKANPAVLIKTQLRSARAGIKTLATVAKALNPALAAIPVGMGGSTDTQSTIPTTVPAILEQENQTTNLLAKLTKLLQEFDQELALRREATPGKIREAEAAAAKAEAALKDLAAILQKKNSERDTAKTTSDDAPTDQVKKAALAAKEAQVAEAEKARNSAQDTFTAATKEVDSRKKELDAWATQWFEEKVKPSLGAYKASLSALLGEGGDAAASK